MLEVWPEGWHALQVFLAMETQWNVAATFEHGLRLVGLRYEALPVVLASLRPLIPPECLQPLAIVRPQIKRMELAAAKWRNAH